MNIERDPWWLRLMLASPLRAWLQPPHGVLKRYLGRGMRAIDLGAGDGYFTIGMARLVGPEGRVLAVERRPELLDRVTERARRAKVGDRVDTAVAASESAGINGEADFILAFWMLHEVREPLRVLSAVREHLKPGGKFLLAEPRHWVGRAYFTEFTDMAAGMGFRPAGRPRICLSRAALFERPAV